MHITITHRRSVGGPWGPCLPNFLVYLVILCFEKRRSKQKYCCSPKIKHSAHHYILVPPKFFGWLRHYYHLLGLLVRSRHQARRQDFAAEWAKNHKGAHFLNAILDVYAATGGSNMKWRSRAPLPPCCRRPCLPSVNCTLLCAGTMNLNHSEYKIMMRNDNTEL